MEAKTTAAEESKTETPKNDEKMPFYRNIGQRNKAMKAKAKAAAMEGETETAKSDDKVQENVEKKPQERIVIDKRYEGYILGIPFHEPLSK